MLPSASIVYNLKPESVMVSDPVSMSRACCADDSSFQSEIIANATNPIKSLLNAIFSRSRFSLSNSRFSLLGSCFSLKC